MKCYALAATESVFTRAARREILRDTVLACRTPLLAARASSGCAARKASLALAASPAASASSTWRTKVRTRERRALLTSVRRAILRVAFFAEVVLAMDASLKNSNKLRHHRGPCGHKFSNAGALSGKTRMA